MLLADCHRAVDPVLHCFGPNIDAALAIFLRVLSDLAEHTDNKRALFAGEIKRGAAITDIWAARANAFCNEEGFSSAEYAHGSALQIATATIFSPASNISAPKIEWDELVLRRFKGRNRDRRERCDIVEVEERKLVQSAVSDLSLSRVADRSGHG